MCKKRKVYFEMAYVDEIEKEINEAFENNGLFARMSSE